MVPVFQHALVPVLIPISSYPYPSTHCGTRTRVSTWHGTRTHFIVPVPVFQHGLVPVLVPISLYPYQSIHCDTRTCFNMAWYPYSFHCTRTRVPILTPVPGYLFWYPTTTLVVVQAESVIVVTTLLNELLFALMLDQGINKVLGEENQEKRGRGGLRTSLPFLLMLNSQFLMTSSSLL